MVKWIPAKMSHPIQKSARSKGVFAKRAHLAQNPHKREDSK
jgi:hypothetical protein